MRTTQQIFDEVAIHLLKQNERSKEDDGGGACLYRGPNGLKCAAGFLIPDELYSVELEHIDWMDLIYAPDDPICELDSWKRFISWARSEGLDRKQTAKVVFDLQVVHDGYEPELWPIELAHVATSNGLSMSTVDSWLAEKETARA